MRFSSSLIVAGLVAGCQTMQSPDAAKADITSATQAWADAFNKCDPARIAALYDAEPVLWGTVSPNIITNATGVRQYFDRACSSPTPPKVAFTEQVIQMQGDMAVNSGSYTFTVMREGKPTLFPARYSMTYRRSGTQWLIVAHHSSIKPAPPK
ncbi:MAG TPA: nuclear transport factor 2 family protein [Burkholderiales bacterium]|nr:nuclear transport factor 2 family protein [Burkholderiales bacterium]